MGEPRMQSRLGLTRTGSKVLGIRLPPDEKRTLETKALQSGVSASEFARAILMAWVNGDLTRRG